MAFLVVFDVAFVGPKVLKAHDMFMELRAQAPSPAEFSEDFGNLARNRLVICASFALPPIIGFALAIALRLYVRNLLLRNQQYLRKEMRKPILRYGGLGLSELRKEISMVPRLISILPQFLPFLAAIIFFSVLDFLVLSGLGSSTPAFLATCGFTCYGTWKSIFTNAMHLESTN